MSFISVVVCDNFLTVMADSRTVELYSNGDVHRILDEDFNKIKQLNENVFIVSSGWVEGSEDFINDSNLCESILEDGKLRRVEELESWFESASKYIIDKYSFRIQLGGLTKDNKLKVYKIKSKSKDLKELKYEENHLSYDFSGIKGLDNNFTESRFKELCKNYNGTAESMLKVQAMLNDIIADNNQSVNKNKKCFMIKR